MIYADNTKRLEANKLSPRIVGEALCAKIRQINIPAPEQKVYTNLSNQMAHLVVLLLVVAKKDIEFLGGWDSDVYQLSTDISAGLTRNLDSLLSRRYKEMDAILLQQGLEPGKETQVWRNIGLVTNQTFLEYSAKLPELKKRSR